MALQSKSISATGSKKHHKFTLTVTEDSTSFANNTSAVSFKLVISPVVKEYDWINNGGQIKYSITVNGTTYSGAIAKYDGVSTVTIKSGTQSVDHATDGTKTISFSFKITDSTSWSFAPGNASASGTMALTNIPRQATITAAPNFNDEQNPTITYSNPAGSAVTALDACISLTGSVDDIKYRPISKTGTSYTFNLTEEERDVLRNATPGKGKTGNTRTVIFYVRTNINGTLYHATSYKTLTIVNADPVLTPYVTESDADVMAADPGAFVRYLSDAYFMTGAEAQKGATIASQSVTCGGVTIEEAEGTISDIQSGDFVFTATDSRGNTTTLPVPVPFVEYIKPTCSIGNSKPDTDGDFTLTASGVCYTGEVGSLGPNDIYVLYRYKAGSGSYSDWMDMAVSVGDNAYTATMNFSGLDYRTTYTFQCKVGDLLTTATTDEVPIKSMPVFDWSGEDFNFNVPVAAPSMTLGGVQLDYIVEQGERNGWIYRKWNSGLAECWNRVQISTSVTSTWGNLSTSGAIAATNLTYPFTFTELPYLTATLAPFGVGGILMVPGSAYGSATQTGAFEIARGTTVSNAQYLIAYYAIGKWK